MPNRCVSQKQIALLHVAKAQLGMSDDVYREMLGSVGVVSSVQLDERKFNEIMMRMEAGGFRTVSKIGKGSRRAKGEPTPGQVLQLRKISALLADMGLPDGYADGIARQMWGVDKIDWCRPHQLRGVIAALVKKQKKGEKSEPKNRGGSEPKNRGISNIEPRKGKRGEPVGAGGGKGGVCDAV